MCAQKRKKEKDKYVTCRCGKEFDLFKAPWCNCKDSFTNTKVCPDGHCICHKLDKSFNAHEWRSPTPEERKEGFGSMLREAYGGVKNVK